MLVCLLQINCWGFFLELVNTVYVAKTSLLCFPLLSMQSHGKCKDQLEDW